MKNKLAKWKPYIFLAVLLASLFLWYGWDVTIIPPGMIIITVKPIWSGSRPEASHRPFPPPVPVSPKAIRSGRNLFSAVSDVSCAQCLLNTAYHLVTFVILLLLCGGIFYLLRPLVCHFLHGEHVENGSRFPQYSVSCASDSGLSMRQLYWYNGSMYYTGFFFTRDLFFLGTLLRYLYNGKKITDASASPVRFS